MSEGQELRSILLGPGRRACGVDSSDSTTDSAPEPYSITHTASYPDFPNYTVVYPNTNPETPFTSGYLDATGHPDCSSNCSCFQRGLRARGNGSHFREEDLAAARRAASLATKEQGE